RGLPWEPGLRCLSVDRRQNLVELRNGQLGNGADRRDLQLAGAELQEGLAQLARRKISSELFPLDLDGRISTAAIGLPFSLSWLCAHMILSGPWMRWSCS